MRLTRVALCALLMSPSIARADETADCIAAHEEGQVARRDGRFDRAREALAACQRDACPAAIRSRCGTFARELEAAQPTLVVVARDTKGADAGGARVSIDEAPPVDVSGMSVRLDPGSHTLVVTAPGFSPGTKTIRLSEGVKGMQALVALEPIRRTDSLAATEPENGAAPTTGAWAFAIAGGVSLAAAGALSAAGWAIHENLRTSCGASGCSAGQVGTLRVLWPASFAALGVGVVSEVIAIVLFTSRSRRPTMSALAVAPASAGLRF